MVLPIFIFMWELHPEWVDVKTHQSEAILRLEWPRWLCCMVTGICGAAGGALLRNDNSSSYLPSMGGGAVMAVGALGSEDLLLSVSRYTNSILMVLALMVGLLPGALVYARLKGFTEDSPYYQQQQPQQSLQLTTYSPVNTHAHVI